MSDAAKPVPPFRALAAILAFALVALAGHAWTRPPSEVPSTAPEAAFSAARAMAHIEAIAQRPHRMGSPEHARVRGYIVERLRALGLTAEVQEAIASRPDYQGTRLGLVRNVVGRMKGTGGGKALLLVAHYDTRSMTPGASDDGYGVAALLETLRALAATGPHPRDVIALFTDGEEEGLLGARAFVADHPAFRDVGVAINFEARGNAGAALMFQTSDDSGGLIEILSRALRLPSASSLSQAIYRRLPNDTDLTEMLRRVPALNVANIGGFERYHAPTDTIANVDHGTLQHHGSYALGLASELVRGPIPPPRQPDATYFDAGPWFVRYPGTWSTPLAVGAAALFAVFVVVASIRKAIRPLGTLFGVFAAVFAVALAGGSALILWSLAAALHPSYGAINAARPLVKDLHLAAFAALAVTYAIGAGSLFAPRVRASEIFTGALALFVAIALLLANVLPGGAFLFAWPALFAIGAGLVLATARAFEPPSSLGFVIALLAPLPAILLIAPFVTQLFVAFGPTGGLASAALVALPALLAAPVWAFLFGSRRRAPLAGLAISFAIHAAAGLVPPFDGGHPRPDTLFLAIDADAKRTFWASPDRAPDAWTESVLSHATQRDAFPLPFPVPEGKRLLAAEIPFVAEPGPTIEWLEDEALHKRFRISTPPGAEVLAVLVEVHGLRQASVEGHQVITDLRGLSFRFYAPPATGLVVDLTLREASPVTVSALSQRPGFPDKASPQPGVRPPGLMAKPGMLPPWDDLLESDMTLVAVTSKR